MLKLSKNCNAFDILSPKMDEVVLVPKLSVLATLVNQHKTALHVIEMLKEHPHEYNSDPLLNRVVGNVEAVSKERVFFELTHELSAQKLCQRYDVIFRPSRMRVRFQYRALQSLKNDKHLRDYLFPSPSCKSNKLATIE